MGKLVDNGTLFSELKLLTVVYNHRTGLVDWTGGLDWWTGLVDWTGGLDWWTDTKIRNALAGRVA